MCAADLRILPPLVQILSVQVDVIERAVLGGYASLITPKYYRSIRYINLNLARPIPIPALVSWPLSFHAAYSYHLSFPARPGSPSLQGELWRGSWVLDKFATASAGA